MSAEAPKPDDAATIRRTTASQWRLMWLKFTDHKLALFALGVVILLYGIALFCEPVAPADPNRRSAERRYAPPQRLRLFHAGRLRWCFAYPQIQHKDP